MSIEEFENQFESMLHPQPVVKHAKKRVIRQCEKCKIDRIEVTDESIVVCPQCGEADKVLLLTASPEFIDKFVAKPKYLYKKQHHLMEKLNHFLCKGSNIPESVIRLVKTDMHDNNLYPDELTTESIKQVLKLNHLNKYYDSAVFIMCTISKKAIPYLSSNEYERVLTIFNRMCRVYQEKYQIKSRKSFLNYELTLKKILEYMDREDIAIYFKQLKNQQKNAQQEQIIDEILKHI